MSYFVTGSTGFIGKFLIEKLLQREGPIYVLVREASVAKVDDLRERFNVDANRIIPVIGDITQANLGISESQLAKLKGKINHFFHLAAIYNLTADAQSQQQANIEGTKQAIGCAQFLEAGCFHLMSSIAAAGLFKGVFREDMFEEAENLEHPYFYTKHEAERIVRTECAVPWRIYRPGLVMGHSQTGETNKIDGPYYLFKLIQKIRRSLPSWMPTIGIEGGRINIVPVDFVVAAMDHIAHQQEGDGQCFHLTDPEPRKVGEVMNIFAHAAHAPEMAMRFDTRMFAFIPPMVRNTIAKLPPVKRIINHVLGDLGIPRDMLKFVNWPTRYDNRDAELALKGSDITVPDLKDYAANVWDYWERNLDPDLFVDRSLSGTVKDKVVVITGASSGIGQASAMHLGNAGAKVVLVARSREGLEETKAAIEEKGGQAWVYTCDLSDLEDCDRLVKQVTEDHQSVDILINNAGRSIRRAVASSFDRFHDFERCMQLNYFGSLRLIMGFLPNMIEKRQGHIINISSIAVLTNAPRFSAYVASKSALETFSACAAAEFSDTGINFTTINMPLVKTPMIAPTKIYQSVPLITTDEAADMITEAIIHKPKRIATRLGIFARVLNSVAPKLAEIVLNTGFRMFPDSSAAKGRKEGQDKSDLSSEQMAFAYFTRGIHW